MGKGIVSASRSMTQKDLKKHVLKASRNKTPRMSPDEKRIARQMHFDQGVPRSKIAVLLQRDLSCICRLLEQKSAPAPIGRPKALSSTKFDGLVALLEKMIDEADANYEVTLAMFMKRSKVKACARVVADALHERGYYFRDLREKPILTPEDVKERYAWAKKYKAKTQAWWRKSIQVHLDNH